MNDFILDMVALYEIEYNRKPTVLRLSSEMLVWLKKENKAHFKTAQPFPVNMFMGMELRESTEDVPLTYIVIGGI